MCTRHSAQILGAVARACMALPARGGRAPSTRARQLLAHVCGLQDARLVGVAAALQDASRLAGGIALGATTAPPAKAKGGGGVAGGGSSEKLWRNPPHGLATALTQAAGAVATVDGDASLLSRREGAPSLRLETPSSRCLKWMHMRSAAIHVAS